MRAKGNSYFGRLYSKVRTVILPWSNSFANGNDRFKNSLSFIQATAPAKYHHLITPSYRTYTYFCIRKDFDPVSHAAVGCRRIVRDQGYLQSLNRPNVRLTFDHIARVEPDGVITETGIHLYFGPEAEFNRSRSWLGEKVFLDVIIYGTGFITV